MTTSRPRRLGPILGLVALLLAVFAPPAAAQDAGQGGSGSSGSDNVAIALNTKDGSSLFKFAFSITKATGEVVDAGNAAVAYASCTDCATVAVAIQFVIVEGSPDAFTPVNVALATNEECSLCTTMALAYQVVIQTDGPVRLTGDGRSRLEDLLRQLKALEDQDLTVSQLNDAVAGIVHQMTQVLSTSMVPVGTTVDDAASSSAASTTTTTTRDEASTTSTTETVRSTTTTRPSGSTTTTSTSSPTSTTTTSTTTTSTP